MACVIIRSLSFIILLQVVSCARILGVFPFPSISHQVVYRALTTELARRGHEVTVITPDPLKDHNISSEYFKQIDVHDISYEIWKNAFNFMEYRKQTEHPTSLYRDAYSVSSKIFDDQMSTPEVQAIIRNDTAFDLLIIESIVSATFGLSWRFKCPVIGISSLSGILSNFEAMGNPTNPVLYPDIFSKKARNLDIWNKVDAVYSYLKIHYIDWINRDTVNTLIKKHFGADAPPGIDLEAKMDLLFLNVFPTLAGIRPTVPGVVYLGGMHIKPKKTLPQDLQKWLDDSPQGVIYMSLGSNVMSKDLSPETLQTILGVFRDLPYKVLWKFEEDLPNRPSNVRTSKWLPQRDLLGHPNIKAFITQGGQQSMEEAISDRVPLIGIPFMGDQDLNVQIFILHGIGVGLNINKLTRQDFEKAILTVARDPSYKKNITRLSQVIFDQPMSSLDRAVWWTEYVLRHRGAQHLRAPAAGMSLVEYFLLDVVGVAVAIAAVAVFVLSYLVCLVKKLLFFQVKLKKI